MGAEVSKKWFESQNDLEYESWTKFCCLVSQVKIPFKLKSFRIDLNFDVGLRGNCIWAFISSTFCSSNNQIVTLSADLLRQIAFSNLHCDKCFNPNDWPPLSSSRKSHSINVKRMWSWNATRFQSHPFGFLGKLNWQWENGFWTHYRQ